MCRCDGDVGGDRADPSSGSSWDFPTSQPDGLRRPTHLVPYAGRDHPRSGPRRGRTGDVERRPRLLRRRRLHTQSGAACLEARPVGLDRSPRLRRGESGPRGLHRGGRDRPLLRRAAVRPEAHHGTAPESGQAARGLHARRARRPALTESGQWLEVGAEPADVVDTNGAGDAFAAGLMVADFLGLSLNEALAVAARSAAISVGSAEFAARDLSLERVLPGGQ